jgi:hypothetical protein
MKKEITVRQFAQELVTRIDSAKGIDCCKEEILALARLAEKEIPDRTLSVNWKDG